MNNREKIMSLEMELDSLYETLNLSAQNSCEKRNRIKEIEEEIANLREKSVIDYEEAISIIQGMKVSAKKNALSEGKNADRYAELLDLAIEALERKIPAKMIKTDIGLCDSFCPNCRFKLDEDAYYCGNCGQAFKD